MQEAVIHRLYRSGSVVVRTWKPSLPGIAHLRSRPFVFVFEFTPCTDLHHIYPQTLGRLPKLEKLEVTNSTRLEVTEI